ncbi:MAG: flagellar hook-length control protein FliK, partial [Sulfurimonas sp.]
LYFKKHDEEKFYCHIDLKLKEYGDISLMLSLYDENQFELYAVAQKEEFAKLLQENLYELRAKLIESEVVPKIIRVTHENQTTQKMSSSYTSYVKSDSSFEVKV